MGLPLYIAPVESDLRDKASTSRNSPTHGPNRIRRVRRNESVVESRRRAIMTAASAAAISRPEGMTETQWQLYRHQQQQPDDPQRRTEERQFQHGIWPRVHLVRPRETLSESISNPSSRENPLDSSRPSRETLIQRFYDRVRDHDQLNGLSNLGRERSSANGNSNTGASTTTNGSNGAPTRVSGLRATPTGGAGGPRDEHRLWYDYITSRSRNQPGRATPGNEGPTAAMTAAIMDNLGSNDEEVGQSLLATLDRRWLDLPSLSSSVSQSSRSPHRRPRTTVEHYVVEGIPATYDGEMDADNARLSHSTSRRASSLRRVMNASASSRRPTVGWSDNNDRASSRSRESSQSRIFGDARQAFNATNRSTLSNSAWTVGYLDMNGERRLPPREERRRREESLQLDGFISTPQEEGWGAPVDAVDGLGDRRRSLSPVGDEAWDTLLTTLTPDPQPPSVGTSFASTSSALAAATAEGQPAWASSSQPTVTQTPVVAALPAVPSPVTRGPDENGENGRNESTPAPILVEASHMPAWFTEEPTALTANASSGTASASTSQQVRSPFTVVSADADTADESAVMFSGVDGEARDDAACEDSEMDDGVHRDGEEEDAPYDEEEQGEEEARAYFMGMTDGPSAEGERSMRSGFGGARPGGNERGSQNPNGSGRNSGSNTQEALELLGIGGMQHIVRSLARREDIPDEWWAEAGLSRTLAREASS
ncbi:hypothetical protein SEUCBS140593_000139 [Sporothrix eucalyptigena]|uniref:Uncharacterized protein n=1 Tax=Sporothrix eucalyptigena TaxID=1812306 RepID=A0ABP0AKJ2_9PEZI